MFEIPGFDVVNVHVTEDAVNGKINSHCIRVRPIGEWEVKIDTRTKVKQINTVLKIFNNVKNK
jgi:hypothetical protein